MDRDSGYITIDIPKIEKQILTALDLNKDGKLDKDDYKFFSTQALSVHHDALFHHVLRSSSTASAASACPSSRPRRLLPLTLALLIIFSFF